MHIYVRINGYAWRRAREMPMCTARKGNRILMRRTDDEGEMSDEEWQSATNMRHFRDAPLAPAPAPWTSSSWLPMIIAICCNLHATHERDEKFVCSNMANARRNLAINGWTKCWLMIRERRPTTFDRIDHWSSTGTPCNSCKSCDRRNYPFHFATTRKWSPSPPFLECVGRRRYTITITISLWLVCGIIAIRAPFRLEYAFRLRNVRFIHFVPFFCFEQQIDADRWENHRKWKRTHNVLGKYSLSAAGPWFFSPASLLS